MAAAPSPLASSVEKTNGAKLSRLLIDGGTTVLKIAFDHYHAPANLAVNLNLQFKILRNLLRRRILNKSQWDKLFPPSGVTPDSSTFDITLLFLLLTNICGLAPPSSGWHSKPHPSDSSFEANLARIKFFRNEVYGHVSNTSVDTPTFNALWQEISAVLVSLGLSKAEIDRLNDERCGEEDYIDALLEWADSEEDTKSQLRDISHAQTETKEIVSELRQTQQECGIMLEENKSRLEELSKRQATTHEAVKEGHETLHIDLKEVKQEIDQLKKKQEIDMSDEILRNLAKAEFKGDIEHHTERFQQGTREWIFKKVEEWLDDRHSPNRVMVISGNAGMGKSVIAAIVCKRMQGVGRLSGSHFCQHNNVRYSKPQLMLQSLACHLSHTLPEYKNALVEQLSRNLGVDLNGMGVEELFSLLFKEPLSSVSDPERSILMVIDGLDESEYQGRNELLDVVSQQLCKLPKWIRFLVTTRPEINISDSLKHLHPIQLEESQEENLRDIRLFFEMHLSSQIEEAHRAALLRKLVDKSDGVFLYAYFLMDFIEKNVSILNLHHLESILPLGIASVFLSNFKRLENELCKEVKIEEEEVLRFVCALSASTEPLPVEFVVKVLVPRGSSLAAHRRVHKVIACISTLLPVRDGRLHFFHKSVKDWLTSTSSYGQHDFTVDEKVGHQILFNLCTAELERVKQKGPLNLQFSDTEKYALQHCIQHMIDAKELNNMSVSCNIEEFVNNYVIDLRVTYAKLCVDKMTPTADLVTFQNHVQRSGLSERSCFLIDGLLKILQKHSHVLIDHPHLFFQCIVNEGSPEELSSKAGTILESELFIPYMKFLLERKQNEAVQTRFYCSETVACFDVSPEKDYMVCECRDGTIHLWSLETSNLLWIRCALKTREFYRGRPFGCAYRQIKIGLSFFHSVVFHPNGLWILPGILANVYTLSGDKIALFPNSNCTFSHCVFSGDKEITVTDCPEEPKEIVVWSMKNGDELARMDWREPISSFTISRDGRLIAFSAYDELASTGSVYLLDIEKQCCWHLTKFNDFDVCGLMHFTSDNNTLACGVLSLNSAMYGSSWYLMFTRRPRFYLLPSINEVIQSTSADCPSLPCDSGTFVLWPIESHSTTQHDFLEQKETSSWVNDLHNVFPFLLTGMYMRLIDDTVLIGSPSFKYVAAVNTDKLNEVAVPCSNDDELNDVDLSYPGERIIKVEMSKEGDTIYSICFSKKKGFEDLVTVLRMSRLEILSTKTFTYLVSLIPMEEGVIIFLEGKVPELWDFELSECIRPLTILTGNEELIPVSEELVACRRIDTILDLYDRLSRSFDDILELDDNSISSIPFPHSLFEERIQTSYSENNDCHCEFGSEPLVLNILNVSKGKFVSSVTTLGPCLHSRHSVSCNSQCQVVVCTWEKIPLEHTYWVEDFVTVSFWNNSLLMWRRSTVWTDLRIRPHFIFSPGDDFVVAWKSLEHGFGLHILDANTGETVHTFFKDRIDIIDSKFVDGESLLVCCTQDNLLRLFNVRSGDLLSVLDLEERPFSLGACPGNSLVAIGLWGRLTFLHVELPKIKDATKING